MSKTGLFVTDYVQFAAEGSVFFMEKRVRAVLLATAAVLTAMLWWSWAKLPPAPLQVRAGYAVVQDIYNSVTVPGTVEAAASEAVAPAETVRVTGLCVRVGDMVEEGDALCAVSPAQAQNLTGDTLRAAWSGLTGVSAPVAAAQAGGVLRAPRAGVVLSLPEQGQTLLAGIACAQIADLTRLQVRAQVPELYADQVESGQRANVTAAAVGDRIYAAKVESIAPAAVRAASLIGGSSAATVETVLPLRGSGQGLRPGYTASVKIFTDFRPNAVVVPQQAICQRGEQEYVFRIEQGIARQCAVTSGYMLESVTEVTTGLSGGEQLVLSPPETLQDGMRVEVVA